MPQRRKLEYFEDQLLTSPQGRAVLSVITEHADEVIYLIQNNRSVMVCWQRNQGPKFIRSIVDSGFEDEVEYVKEIDGINLEMLILSMTELLQDNGSVALKSSIGKYTVMLLKSIRESSSLKEILSTIHQHKKRD